MLSRFPNWMGSFGDEKALCQQSWHQTSNVVCFESLQLCVVHSLRFCAWEALGTVLLWSAGAAAHIVRMLFASRRFQSIYIGTLALEETVVVLEALKDLCLMNECRIYDPTVRFIFCVFSGTNRHDHGALKKQTLFSTLMSRGTSSGRFPVERSFRNDATFMWFFALNMLKWVPVTHNIIFKFV